ncbi:hypothetical protein CMUST_05320 [Corynebacterium mustelae]|uniref:Uncharacterized protein n=1 Tax=Corynebacterium mustelae TaxID=571915 RepID=A0A0G3H2P9_9CORY|nr:hypothetical protein CMUST_05320 [Corynebacterium mustelae]
MSALKNGDTTGQWKPEIEIGEYQVAFKLMKGFWNCCRRYDARVPLVGGGV